MSILAWIEDQKRLKLLNAPKYVNPSSDSSKGLWTRCDKCGVILYIKHLKENQRVCFGCSYHLQMSSQERVENILDKNSWRPLDETVSPCDPLEFHDQKDYTDRLEEAQERTGLQDAIQTGSGMVDGIPVALGIMDFEFMGGSMGSVVGEKVTRLIEYATQEGLILLLVCASGGARMQEGVFSLMQMAKVSSALQVYQSCANLLYISILTSPTTGGVTASFAMLGDIIFAEPKALIAFAGRRVIEQTLCEDLPEDFQTSEYMLHHGLLDLLVPRRFLRQALSETIRLYKNAPFKRPGRIPYGVQNPITFLTEEKLRRRYSVESNLSHRESIPDYIKDGTREQKSDLTSYQKPHKNGEVRSQKENTETHKLDQSLYSSTNSPSHTTLPPFADRNGGSGKGIPKVRRSGTPVQTGGKVSISNSIVEGQALTLTNRYQYLQKDFSISRETKEYRNILTSFQTMFHLFSKQQVVPFPPDKISSLKTEKTGITIQDMQLEPKKGPLHAEGKEPEQGFLTFGLQRQGFQHLLEKATYAKQSGVKVTSNWSNDQTDSMPLLSNEQVYLQKLLTLLKAEHSTETQNPKPSKPSNGSKSDATDAKTLSRVNLDLLDQSLEYAAQESVEWRAFYVYQAIENRTGFLEDLLSARLQEMGSRQQFLASADEQPEKSVQATDMSELYSRYENTLFYKSISQKTGSLTRER